MTHEQEIHLRKKDLKGFILSPNEEAELLEQHLGIIFPVKPAKVELSLRNRVVYGLKGGLPNLIASLLRTKSIGRYVEDYGALFVYEDDLFTPLHENMHAFNYSVNPEIYTLGELLARSVATRFVGQTPIPIDMEKAITYRCFDEGMAQWAALETASHMPEDFEEIVTRRMKNVLSQGESKDEDVKVNKVYVGKQFENIEEAITLYQSALERTGIETMKIGIRAETALDDARYVTGYFFVNQAINTLLKDGITLGQAITTLVKNPPSTVGELKDPSSYCQQLHPKQS